MPETPGLADPLAAVPVVDEGRLAPIRELGGSTLVDVLRLYRQTSPRYLSALAEAVDRGDPAAVGAAGHALRGSSAGIGLARLAERLLSLEAAARDGDLDRVRALHARVVADAGEADARLAALTG